MNTYIPVNTPLFGGNEKKYLAECIDTGWISSEGSFVKKFENEFSAYCDRKFGVAVANGSAALDIAIKALGITAGDEVIMPAFSIISPLFSVMKQKATPVFVDSCPDTWNINPKLIEEKITPQTKAIIVVHTYGLPAAMDEILAIAEKHRLYVIEDAAEVHGQTYNAKRCGSFGHISIFSFYANKLISSGEGGMILCDDDALAARCRKYRNLSFEPDGPRFVHHETGWNYRMTNLQAAVGVAQLEQIEHFIGLKREIGNRYNSGLSFLKNHGYQIPLAKTAYATNIYWVFGLVAPSEKEKEKIVAFLKGKGVDTRPFFWSLNEQPLLISRENTCRGRSTCPIAENLARCGFYIPSGLGLKMEEQEYIIETFKDYYE
ncbi:MAG: DegT/DnrJ/EryC1/StrS family aminotransferase [Edaphocola sp.]